MKTKLSFQPKAILFLILILGLTSFTLAKKFPILNSTTLNGKTIDDSYFAQKNTLVMHLHLGCPGAMYAIRDFQVMADSLPDDIQLLYILENTPNQIQEYNSEEKNMWSDIRKYYKTAPIEGDVVAECENGTEDVHKSGEDIVIGPSCRVLSKKLHFNYSPAFFYVDKTGKITGRRKGYPQTKDGSGMWKLIQDAR